MCVCTWSWRVSRTLDHPDLLPKQNSNSTWGLLPVLTQEKKIIISKLKMSNRSLWLFFFLHLLIDKIKIAMFIHLVIRESISMAFDFQLLKPAWSILQRQDYFIFYFIYTLLPSLFCPPTFINFFFISKSLFYLFYKLFLVLQGL